MPEPKGRDALEELYEWWEFGTVVILYSLLFIVVYFADKHAKTPPEKVVFQLIFCFLVTTQWEIGFLKFYRERKFYTIYL